MIPDTYRADLNPADTRRTAERCPCGRPGLILRGSVFLCYDCATAEDSINAILTAIVHDGLTAADLARAVASGCIRTRTALEIARRLV
jgi:hypothetical protein